MSTVFLRNITIAFVVSITVLLGTLTFQVSHVHAQTPSQPQQSLQVHIDALLQILAQLQLRLQELQAAQTNTNTLAASVVQTSVKPLANPLARWERREIESHITSLQYKNAAYDSFGAIVWNNGIAVYEDGSELPLKRVVPYFAHLGVLGMLEQGGSNARTVAERWMTWYVHNIDETAGVPLDTWYTTDGSYGTTCPVSGDERQCDTVDAEDSSAALFLAVVRAYLAAGGSTTFVKSLESDIRVVEDTLFALITPDGLSWAKQTYPIKYLMDNVEVLAGLEASAYLQANVFVQPTRATQVNGYISTLRAALYGSQDALYDTASKTFYLHKDGAGTKEPSDMQTWYPDVMAQIWPYAFKQHAEPTLIARVASTLAVDKGCSTVLQNTQNKHEPVVAYALRTQGMKAGSDMTKCMFRALRPGYGWPTHVGDLGWLLRK